MYRQNWLKSISQLNKNSKKIFIIGKMVTQSPRQSLLDDEWMPKLTKKKVKSYG